MSARIIVTVMLALGAIAPAWAGTNDAFAVTSAAGARIPGATLLAGNRKVIVYVAPGLDPAARLVQALSRWSHDDNRWRDSLVVIVAAPLDEARTWLRDQWGDDDLPNWAADADAQGWRALGFQGTVGVAGVESGAVDWKLDGVIADPSVVEPSMRAWTGIGAR